MPLTTSVVFSVNHPHFVSHYHTTSCLLLQMHPGRVLGASYRSGEMRSGDQQPITQGNSEGQNIDTPPRSWRLVATINHFSYHLYGTSFKAYTDHKPLEQLTTSTRLNPRLSRLALKLQHWLVQIKYLPGQLNTLADALSREERQPEASQQQWTSSVQDTQHHHTEEDASVPGRHLAAGDVEGTPPQGRRANAGSRLTRQN